MLVGYEDTEVEAAKSKRDNLQKLIDELESDDSDLNVRSVQSEKKSHHKYPWDQKQWLEMLDRDDDHDSQRCGSFKNSQRKDNLFNNLPDSDAMNLSIDHYLAPENSDLQFDDSEFVMSDAEFAAQYFSVDDDNVFNESNVQSSGSVADETDFISPERYTL